MWARNRSNRTALAVAMAGLAVVALRPLAAAGADAWGQSVVVGAGAVDRCSSEAVNVKYILGYVAEIGGYGVTAVDLTGMAAQCVGRDVDVTLTGADWAPLAALTARVTASEMRLDVPAAAPVSAEKLTGVSMVISK